jgi:hypothetical protein
LSSDYKIFTHIPKRKVQEISHVIANLSHASNQYKVP